MTKGTEEGYIQAFSINPETLSPEVAIVMEQYANHLLVLDQYASASNESVKRLEEFTNSLFGIEEYLFDYTAGTLYRDVYMDNLRNASLVELQGYTILLAAMDPTQEGYDEKYKEYETVLAMANFWATGDIILDKLACYTNEPERFQCSISNLTFEAREAKFDLNHFSPQFGKIVSEKVKTKLSMNGSLIGEDKDARELKAIAKAQKKAVENLILNLGKDISLTTLSVGAPMVAIPASILLSAVEGKAGTVQGLDALGNTEAIKVGLKYGNVISKNILNTCIDCFNQGTELKQSEMEVELKWFGSAGSYSVEENRESVLSGDTEYTFTGRYNPNTIRKMIAWEEEGMRG